MLLLAWMDTTRQPHMHAQNGAADGAPESGGGESGGGGAVARTMRLLARPPPLVDALLPRIVAVLLAAHTRLGHVSHGVGGGALVGLCSLETLQLLFGAYRLRRGGGMTVSAASARGGGLGNEVAWGVASVIEQYGLGGLGGAGAGGAEGEYAAIALLMQPPSMRAFQALLQWAGGGARAARMAAPGH